MNAGTTTGAGAAARPSTEPAPLPRPRPLHDLLGVFSGYDDGHWHLHDQCSRLLQAEDAVNPRTEAWRLLAGTCADLFSIFVGNFYTILVRSGVFVARIVRK
ncbi:hypothetical protein Bbelb_387980 [Branchiostoma belcheri]|nr:hypothetical protein Bbelb_387980 [Branchiostoma belcheri]